MQAHSRGRFITVEGSEGVGKTSNIERLAITLQERGYPVYRTREPGGTELGEQIRELLLAVRDGGMEPMAELLLVFAARAQHVGECIRPALERGEVVLCDRFTDATYAYQGAGRGIAQAAIAQLAQLTHADLTPDVTFFLDADPGIAMQRIQDRTLDRFEREQQAFFARVREGYLQRAREDPERFEVVNAAAELAAVTSDIEQRLLDRLARWSGE